MQENRREAQAGEESRVMPMVLMGQRFKLREGQARGFFCVYI